MKKDVKINTKETREKKPQNLGKIEPKICPKTHEGEVQSKTSLKDFSFSRLFGVACKNLENFIETILRNALLFFSGYIGIWF